MNVSVFIPCIKKHLHYVPEVVRQYLSGTVAPFEIVLFVSGMDGAPVPPILGCRIVKEDGKVLAGIARQRALDLCSGDIVMYQDADDLPHPRRVEIVKRWFESHDTVHLTHGYIFMGRQKFPEVSEGSLGPEWIFGTYFPAGNLSDCSRVAASWGPDMCFQHAGACCIRREVLKSVQWKANDKLVLAPGVRAKSEDYEFCMEVAFKFRKSVMLMTPLYSYRTNDPNAVSTSKEATEHFINGKIGNEEELLRMFGADEQVVIADIGACDGCSSIHYSRMFKNAFILVFEARPDNYAKMLGNFGKYQLSSYFAWNVAISDRNGTADFHCSSGQAPGVITWDTGNKSSSLFQPKKHLDIHKWCKFDEKMTVITRKLDCVMCETTVPGIDFIHLDVQGAEKLVLDGACRTLQNVRAIWCEVSNVEMYAGQPKKDEMCQYLSRMGFRVAKDTCGNEPAGDCLFVRN